MKKLIISMLFIALSKAVVVGQINPYPFEVQISGQGNQAIIFIPGFASAGEVWDETKLMYESHYRCYTLTMAGFAGVAPQPNPSISKWEHAIADYIKKNNLKKPIVVGHSMGGVLAMALAADYPDLLSKVVVVDGLPCLTAMMNPSFIAKEENDCTEMITQMASVSDEQFFEMQTISIKYMLADTSRQKEAINWSIQSDRNTFAKIYCDFTNTDLRVKIANIKCPSLILLEPHFLNFQSAINEQFKNMKQPNIQFATKGLHFIMYDDKMWYDQQLANFINPKGTL